MPDSDKKQLFGLRASAYLVDLLAIFLLAVCTTFVTVLAFALWRYGGDEKLIKAMVADSRTRHFAQCTHIILYLSYFTITQWYFGRSPGKMLFRLTISRHGRELTFAQSLVRSLGYFLSGQITLGAGFLLPLFRRDGRALHDLLAGTVVKRLPDAQESRVESFPSTARKDSAA
jgi:uncharacterized RDD family membrane protein YckC